jgi:hypothetical protein
VAELHVLVSVASLVLAAVPLGAAVEAGALVASCWLDAAAAGEAVGVAPGGTAGVAVVVVFGAG